MILQYIQATFQIDEIHDNRPTDQRKHSYPKQLQITSNKLPQNLAYKPKPETPQGKAKSQQTKLFSVLLPRDRVPAEENQTCKLALDRAQDPGSYPCTRNQVQGTRQTTSPGAWYFWLCMSPDRTNSRHGVNRLDSFACPYIVDLSVGNN